MGTRGDITKQRRTMKSNYIFNSIDLSKVVFQKVKIGKEWKKLKKKEKKKRKERIYKNRIPKQYKVYIKSKWWTKRKNKFYRKYGKICQACQSTKYIDLHHMLYANYGNEEDIHLVALCRGCHEEYHSIHGVKRNMIKETHQFIIEKREIADFPKV